MNRKMICAELLSLLSLGLLAGADFSSESYTFNALADNKAGIHLAIAKEPFIMGHFIRACVRTPEKAELQLRESSGSQYIYENNTMETLRRLIAPNNILFGEINRIVQFAPEKITVNIKVTSRGKYAYSATWHVPYELMFVSLKQLRGASLEGIQNGKVAEKLSLPEKNNRWGLKTFYPEIVVRRGNRKITITATEGALVGLKYYGEKDAELYIRPVKNKTELNTEPGAVLEFGYTISIQEEQK